MTTARDIRFFNLIRYVNSAISLDLVSHVGDNMLIASSCSSPIHTLPDIELPSQWQVSLALVGESMFHPIATKTRGQTAVSDSSSEAEVKPKEYALRVELLSASDCRDTSLPF